MASVPIQSPPPPIVSDSEHSFSGDVEESSQPPTTSDEERELKELLDDACSPLTDPYLIGECMEFLNAMEGVGAGEYLKASESFRDRDWRIIFIKMPAGVTRYWVDTLK